MMIMIIDDNINNIREIINKCDTCSEKKIFESILDILQDISIELEELNESLTY
jgi:hypothetical protein